MDYVRANRTAVQQIDKFGRIVIVRTMSEGDYDPATDTFTDTGSTDVSVKAVFVDYKEQQMVDTSIQRGDKLCLIANVTNAPQVNDIIVDGTDEYKVINLKTVQPGDTPILYKLQVRR